MSFIAPILPDNAPFTPLQRAWLDGFLAGLFGGVPGGQATSRALRELLAGFAAPAANTPTVAAAAVMPTAPAPLPGAADAPSPARLVIAQRLNRDGSEKDTRHIVLATEPGA